MTWRFRARRFPLLAFMAVAYLWVIASIPAPAIAQPSTPGAPPAVEAPASADAPAPAPAPAQQREKVHADISTRSVRVTSSFTGTEIIVFGSIEHGRPEDQANDDIYDVVVVLEGTPQKLVARRKSHVAGIWINTQALTFESVPSYYAISSTRPLLDVADPIVLRNNDIGFEQVRMKPISGWETGISTAGLRKFKEAVIRLKQKTGLYVQNDYGVVFVGGASLFRTTIDLPANVPVGTLHARVYLFRKGQMLSEFKSQVLMQREGIERYLHDFAFGYPLLYGIAAVFIAAGAGLAASSYFGRNRG
ncbi:MAG: TIGR02186 family protein [Phycisphaerales bacterium]|nr:TIGR02186 family protein [Phycisphaerales bacterium]